MKKLQLTTLLIAALALFAACGKSNDSTDDFGNNRDNSIRITEIQEKVGDVYKPYFQFVYDDKNRISEVKFFEWSEDGTTKEIYCDGAVKWLYSWGSDGKLKKIFGIAAMHTEDNYRWKNIEDIPWGDDGVYIVGYSGNNISQVTFDNGYNNFKYKCVWEDGKLVKIIHDDENEYTLLYNSENNCFSVKRDNKAILSYTYDIGHDNYHSYLPVECFMAMEQIWSVDVLGIFFSKENTINQNYKQVEDTTFEYTYENGRTTGFTRTLNGQLPVSWYFKIIYNK